jgi:hypothetical protein
VTVDVGANEAGLDDGYVEAEGPDFQAERLRVSFERVLAGRVDILERDRGDCSPA